MPDRNASKSLPAHAVELKDLVVAYAKQETIGPLKELGRFVKFGLAGMAFLSVGLPLLVLAVLRLLQTEFDDTFESEWSIGSVDGDWSFAPYLITLVICAVIVVLGIRGVLAAKRRKRS